MTDEQNSLLRAVCDASDDDLVRLVYADWLEEHGQPERAEFIRVQVERAGGGRPPDRRTALLKRSMHLIQQHGSAWFAADWPGAATAGSGYSFDRGFADRVSMAHTRMRSADVARVVDDRPMLSLLHTWVLSGNRIDDAGLEAIAASPRVARLRYLGITGNPFTIRGLQALAESPYLAAPTPAAPPHQAVLFELAVGYWLPPGPHDPAVAVNPVVAAHTARDLETLFADRGKRVRVRV